MRHPVDRMHDLREQIRALILEHRTIREGILSGAIGTQGDEYHCKSRTQLVLRPVPKEPKAKPAMAVPSPLSAQQGLGQHQGLGQFNYPYQNFQTK